MSHADRDCALAQSSSATPLKVMIMGAPAAGKGTQCEKIVEKVCLLTNAAAVAVQQYAALQVLVDVAACCETLRDMQYKLVHISVGDLLRAEVAAGTPAGRRAQSFMDSGNLVPNEVLLSPPISDGVRGPSSVATLPP